MGRVRSMTNLIKLELIDLIQFCLKIYDLWRHPYLWVDWWVNGWAHVKSLNQINLDLIEIIQLWTFWTYLYLDILLKPPQPLMGLFLYLKTGWAQLIHHSSARFCFKLSGNLN